MTKQNQKKYRNESLRLKNWDYSSNGAYFITFCTKNREQYFGRIESNKMILNELGEIAHHLWLQIPTYFPFITLDEFVIIPDHIHGILVINNAAEFQKEPQIKFRKHKYPDQSKNDETQYRNDVKSSYGGVTGYDNPMFHDIISRVIRWHKGRCSFEIKKSLAAFAWQSRFYDHIIRTPYAHENIVKYIRNNPADWIKKTKRLHGVLFYTSESR